MAATGVALQIDEKWIEPIIAAEVQAALVRTLGGDVYTRTIDGIVRQALGQRVDRDGRPSTYSNDRTFIQYTIDNAIRDITRKVIREVLEQRAEELRGLILEALDAQRGDMASALVASLMKGAGSDWNFRITTQFEKRGEE